MTHEQRMKQQASLKKQRVYNASTYAKSFMDWKKGIKKLSKSEQTYLSHRIYNAFYKINDYCCDNFRICYGHLTIAYQLQRNGGCCGFYDETVTFKNGKKVVFGFNYGH